MRRYTLTANSMHPAPIEITIEAIGEPGYAQADTEAILQSQARPFLVWISCISFVTDRIYDRTV